MSDSEKKDFYIVGNNLALDFLNSEIAVGGEPRDLFENFRDVCDWAAAAGAIAPERAANLIDQFGETEEAQQAFADALDFRATLKKATANFAAGKKINPSAVEAVNRLLARQSGFMQIRQTAEGLQKRRETVIERPAELLAPVAEAAADLFVYGNPEYIKKCEAATCVLHFYDTTKNHTRRWCSMQACGNRAKAAAFYERRKAKSN